MDKHSTTCLILILLFINVCFGFQTSNDTLLFNKKLKYGQMLHGSVNDTILVGTLGTVYYRTLGEILSSVSGGGVNSINTGTAAAHTIVGEKGLQVLDSGTNLYKHVIIPATGYIIPTGSNMRVDSTTLADSAADAGKWGGNVYGGPYLGIHATADTAIAADRARKLATTRTIGKSTTFDGTANIVPDSAVSVVQATQLTTARTIGNTSFNGTAAIIPDTANKANRARYSDSTGKIPDTVHIRLGLSANNINVSNVQTTNLNGTAIGSAYSVVGADQSGAAAARQAAYANLTSIGSLANGTGWLKNNGSGSFTYTTPSYSDVGASPALSLTAGYIPKAATTTTLSNSALRDNGSYFMDITGTNPIFKLAGTSNNDNPQFMLYHLNDQIWAFNLQGSTPITGSANKDLTINDGGNNNFITLKSGGPVLLAPNADRNVGIGATSALTNLQIGNRYGLINISTNTELSNNLYYSSGWKYLTSSYGSSFEQDGSGNFNFYTAPSGTAGNSASLTTVMSILLNGNVSIGPTSPDSQFTTSAGAHIRGGLLVGGTATINNNVTVKGGNDNTFDLDNDGSRYTYQYFRNNGNIKGSLGYDNSGNAFWMGSDAVNASTVIQSGNGSEAMRILSNGNVSIGTTNLDSQFTTSAGAHIGGGLLVGGTATIENNIVLGDYGGIPGFYMKSDNLSIGSQTGGLYGQITSNGWSIQSEITAPSMNVSGNDTVGGQIRAGGLYTTGYDTSYYGYTRFTTANQMVVDTFGIRHSEKLYDSIATMTTTFTFDCAHMRPLCTMTSATAGGTVSFINISDGLVFIFINATANSINLTLTHGTVGLGAYQGMTLICSQTSIFEEL
ncbi:MAG: hypothetical protein WBM07_10725 [Chitinivibrionales bacterium]